jgi:hypothetical protein
MVTTHPRARSVAGAHPHHNPASKNKLVPNSALNFPGQDLFSRVARAVCEAECLPRKELYESWEVARRVRRRFSGRRVVDLAAGHGLLAHLLLLLDDSAPQALAVDVRIPASAGTLTAVLCARWPRLRGRVQIIEAPLESVALGPDDLVVSAHACGQLTDRVLDLALAARAAVVVLPCCHGFSRGDRGGLEGWLDPALAMDVVRADRLRRAGYRVHTQLIPAEITPKNRLLLGHPPGT